MKASGIGLVVGYALMLAVRSVAMGSNAAIPEASEALMNAFTVLTYGALVIGSATTWFYVRRRRGTGPTLVTAVIADPGVDVAAWTERYAIAPK